MANSTLAIINSRNRLPESLSSSNFSYNIGSTIEIQELALKSVSLPNTAYNININNFNSIMECNVTFILETLKVLIDNNLINDNAKMVLISSIWEDCTRDNKLSYSISKGCLTNLVKNIAFDMSNKKVLINNVLPGPIDNDMTNSTLSKEQIKHISEYTGFNRLVSLEDIYNTVYFLLVFNTGITGQSIKVDLGFTNIKKY